MIKPVYLVWDDEAKRYIHNTTRDIGIYSSRAEEFFSREDLEEAYYRGWSDRDRGIIVFTPNVAKFTEELIEHDGKPYKGSE